MDFKTTPERYIFYSMAFFIGILIIVPTTLAIASQSASNEFEQRWFGYVAGFFAVASIAGSFLLNHFLKSFDKSISEQRISQEQQFKILRETDEKQFSLIKEVTDQTREITATLARHDERQKNTEERQRLSEERCITTHRGV
jgi:hypothetical protein